MSSSNSIGLRSSLTASSSTPRASPRPISPKHAAVIERQQTQQRVLSLTRNTQSEALQHLRRHLAKIFDAICADTRTQNTQRAAHKFQERVMRFSQGNSICLKNHNIGSAGVLALVKALKDSHLAVLDLSANSLGDLGLSTLLRMMQRHVPTLTNLNVASNNIGTRGAAELAQTMATNRSLRILELGSAADSLRGNSIGVEGGRKLAQALSSNFTLSKLGLSGNGLGKGSTGAAVALAACLQFNKALTSIDLARNQLATKGASVLLDALCQNRAIKAINLSGNGIGPDIGRSVRACLDNTQSSVSALETLRLSDNDLDFLAVQELAVTLATNSTLTLLDLSSNDVQDEGAISLADALCENHTLRSLNLSDNGLGVDGGQALALALQHNDTLAELSLASNAIGNVAAEQLGAALLANRSLKVLDASACKISDDGAMMIASALEENTTTRLQKLRLRNNFISRAAGSAIADSLFKCQTLFAADFRGNRMDHPQIARINEICKRNERQFRSTVPRQLKTEIRRLKGEQEKLKQAQDQLRHHKEAIDVAEHRIAAIDEEKSEFLRNQDVRRSEIRSKIDIHKDSLSKAHEKIETKRVEQSDLEAAHKVRLQALRKELEDSKLKRAKTEQNLSHVKSELDECLAHRAPLIEDIQRRIGETKQKRISFQNQVAHIRQEYQRLSESFSAGMPLLDLISDARKLLQPEPDTDP